MRTSSRYEEEVRSRSPSWARTTRDRRHYSPPPPPPPRRDENEDSRRRRHSPPPPRHPPRRCENEDNRRLHSRYDVVSSPNAVPLLSEQGGGRPGTVLNGEIGGDGHFDESLRKQLSQFNEGLPHRASPSMKFQWKHLFDERANSNAGGNAANPSLYKQINTTSYGGGGSADSNRMNTEREFQGIRYPDLDRHDTVVAKPMSLGINRAGGGGGGALLPPSYHLDVGIGQGCSVQLNGKLQSPAANTNLGVRHHDDEELSIRDTLRQDESLRDLYRKYINPPMLMNDKSHYMMPSSSPRYDYASASLGISHITKNNFPGFFSEGLHTSADGISISRGMVGEPVTASDEYARPTINSCINPELQVNDVMNHSSPWRILTEAQSRGYAYPEIQRTERRDFGEIRQGKITIDAWTDELCGKVISAGEGYDHQDRLRASIVDPIVARGNDTEGFRGDHLRQSRVFKDHHSLREQPGVFEDHHSLQEQPSKFKEHCSLQEQQGEFEDHVFEDHCSLQERRVPFDYSDVSVEQPDLEYPDHSGALHPYKQGGDLWGSRMADLQFETEQYRGHESVVETENYQDREGLHETQKYGEREISQMGQDYGSGTADVPWSFDENLSMLPMSDCAADQYGIGEGTYGRLTAEEVGMPGPSENMLKRKRGLDKNMSRHKPRGRLLSHTNEQLSGEHIDNWHLPNKLHHSQNKKDLRSCNEMASLKTGSSEDWLSSRSLPTTLLMRLSKSEISAGRDIKKRLRPGPQNNSKTSSGKNQSIKFEKRRQDGFHGILDAQAGNPSEAKVVPAKINPREDSEDFKQLVNIAFLKFVKQLYENPAQRRRYMEQGKTGKLKCSICASDSVYVDMNSLAMHVFNSLKVEFRPQHLGFHKALCVLMGWNNAVSPNSFRLVLPKAEAWALKEDLVIWPPVVIIHNSSIGNKDPDKRIVVTIEALETILRDMGFDGERTKVCRGKVANQSIMVVRFKGTLSGLQEAEKLHKIYAESTHGRCEFQQISSDSGNNSQAQNRLADKVEHVLYGYLGIAEDLDKLDFDTKKRSLVKSKKEILSIADASFKTE